MNPKLIAFVQTFTNGDVALTQEQLLKIQSSTDERLLQADSHVTGPERIDDVVSRLQPLIEAYAKDSWECLWLYETNPEQELRMDEYCQLVKGLAPWSNHPWVMKRTTDIRSIRISVLYYQ